MAMPAIKFGSGRGAIRSVVIGLLIVYALRKGKTKLAERLASRL